jgi:hypothetical protein
MNPFVVLRALLACTMLPVTALPARMADRGQKTFAGSITMVHLPQAFRTDDLRSIHIGSGLIGMEHRAKVLYSPHDQSGGVCKRKEAIE